MEKQRIIELLNSNGVILNEIESINYFDSDKSHINYIYEMAKATTQLKGGLPWIDTVLNNLRIYNQEVVRTTFVKFEDSPEITVLSDSFYKTYIGHYS